MPLPLSTTRAATKEKTRRARKSFLPPLLPFPPLPIRGRQRSIVPPVERVRPLPLLFSLLLLHLQLQVLGQEEGDGGGVHFVAASQRRHHQERPRGSHVTDRDCPSLCTSGPSGHQGAPGGGPFCRRELRTPPPLLALPPQAPRAVRCGGGPSPAPWQPPSSRDGAMPGAGDPAALRRLQRCRSWHDSQGSTKD